MSDELITPRMWLDHYLRARKLALEDIEVAPVVILSWGWGVIPSLAKKTGASPVKHNIHGRTDRCFRGTYQGVDISLVEVNIGATGTVIAMEQMIASGAKAFIGLGWTGALRLDLPIGSLVIPTSCRREEGTSFHYAEADAPLGPDPFLQRAIQRAAGTEGLSPAEGRLWTTDAPYRELKSKIARYRDEGIIGVDMETSAMYALCRLRGVSVCNLLVVSDILRDDWEQGFFTQNLADANHAAEQVVLRALVDIGQKKSPGL